MCSSLKVWIAGGCLAASSILAQEGPPVPLKMIPDLEYARVGTTSLKLDLYLPEKAGLPLLVWIHGGGWKRGDRGAQPLKWLARQGYALASISYRLSGEAIFPAQIHDCKAAVRWLRVKAGRFGYDGERIGVVGASAGGHLAALLGTTSGIPELDGRVGTHPQVSTRVQAVVDFFGPTDFFLDERRGAADPHVIPGPVKELLGGAPAEKRRLAELAGPAGFVTADDAPLLIIHGDEDRVVAVEQSIHLNSRYRDAGLESRLIRVPGQGHSSGLMEDAEIRAEMAIFLSRHLKTGRGAD